MLQKTWQDAGELADAMEERVLCGAKRIVLTPGTALWIARQIQNAVRIKNGHQAQVSWSQSKFCFDLYGTGSCIVTIDGRGDIVEVVAWARNSLAAGAAFKELCERNPETSTSSGDEAGLRTKG